MAIGATAWDVHRLILGQAVRLVVVGLGVGGALVIGAQPVIGR